MDMKIKSANNDRKRKKMWTRLGRKFNLTFSKYISIGNKFLGLDGTRKRLLVTAGNELGDSRIIELDQLRSVSIRRSYGSIKAGEVGKKKFEEFLKFIHLLFEYKDQNISVIPFYEREIDGVKGLDKLDRALRNVQQVISKLIDSKKHREDTDSAIAM